MTLGSQLIIFKNQIPNTDPSSSSQYSPASSQTFIINFTAFARFSRSHGRTENPFALCPGRVQGVCSCKSIRACSHTSGLCHWTQTFFHVPLLGQGDVTLVRNFTLIGVKHDVRATDDNLLCVFEFQSPKKS